MTDRLPMPTVNTWVGVDRTVLAEVLSMAACDYNDRDEHIEQLSDSVREGRIDVLSRAVFDGTESPR